MKRLLITLFTIFAAGAAGTAWGAESADSVEVAGAARPADRNTLWDKANTAYYNNDFSGAIALYDSIEQSGMVSAKLYYNMGNAWFKAGRIGKSILYYNKARRLAPGDNDIEHNLEIANTYTRNRIEPIPEFFVKRWMGSLSSIMGGNAWAALSVVFFALTLGGALLYLLPLRRGVRKAGFWGGVAALVLFLFSFGFGSRDYREGVESTQAVVTSASASVKSSPDNAGKDLFLLYEGAKVEVRDALNGWSEIVLADGNQGWIKTTAIEMID